VHVNSKPHHRGAQERTDTGLVQAGMLDRADQRGRHDVLSVLRRVNPSAGHRQHLLAVRQDQLPPTSQHLRAKRRRAVIGLASLKDDPRHCAGIGTPASGWTVSAVKIRHARIRRNGAGGSGLREELGQSALPRFMQQVSR
jgi:hypothetical protein